jgi:hypothetical protein
MRRCLACERLPGPSVTICGAHTENTTEKMASSSSTYDACLLGVIECCPPLSRLCAFGRTAVSLRAILRGRMKKQGVLTGSVVVDGVHGRRGVLGASAVAVGPTTIERVGKNGVGPVVQRRGPRHTNSHPLCGVSHRFAHRLDRERGDALTTAPPSRLSTHGSCSCRARVWGGVGVGATRWCWWWRPAAIIAVLVPYR